MLFEQFKCGLKCLKPYLLNNNNKNNDIKINKQTILITMIIIQIFIIGLLLLLIYIFECFHYWRLDILNDNCYSKSS